VPVDEHDLVIDALPASARLVYATPSHQYRSGRRCPCRAGSPGSRVAVQPLSAFRITQPPRAGVALGCGAIDANDIDEGLHLLSRAFDSG
jgi:DNA-binding transcriptional MocR family regulator